MAGKILCPICFDEVKEKNIVKCGFCIFKGCKECVRKSLLYSVNDPQCPSSDCKHTWSYEFCIQHLSKSFMNGPYRKRTRDILFDIEKSKIPATMEIIEFLNEQKTLIEKEKELRKKIDEQTETVKYYRDLLNDTIKKRIHLSFKNKAKKVFKKKCPKESCSGYLCEDHICPICECKVCKDCNEIIMDPSLDGESKHQHICNPDTVASLKFIQKDTKPCPGCETLIHKINGCDQMWCTNCKVPFSWKTGEKVSGIIHNPHFYEWKKNNHTLNRNIGEVLCGGVININIVNRLLVMSRNFSNYIGSKYNFQNKTKIMEKILKKKNKFFVLPIFKTAGHQYDFMNYLFKMHRKISHFEYIELNSIRRNCQERDFMEKSRIEYIRGNISEKKFKLRIIRNDNARRKNTMVLQIFEMLYVTYLETYNDLIQQLNELSQKTLNTENYNFYYQSNKTVFDIIMQKILNSLKRMEKLISYANKELWKVSKLLNLFVPFICFPYTELKKYDDSDFQLYITNNNKNVKAVGKKQEQHFNNSIWFNNSSKLSHWSNNHNKWTYKNVYNFFKNDSKSIHV